MTGTGRLGKLIVKRNVLPRSDDGTTTSETASSRQSLGIPVTSNMYARMIWRNIQQ